MGNENLEQQMNQDLEALFSTVKGSAPAKETESGGDPKVTPDNKQAGDASHQPATPNADADGDSDASDASDASDELTEREKMLKALEALDPEEKPKEGEEKKPETPALSEEQQIILQHIPDAATAETLVNIANSHTAFETALVEGDFEKIEAMFLHWNKDAYDNLVENIYKKHGEEWVKRFVSEYEAEQNGTSYENQRQSKLEKEVASLKQRLAQQDQQKQTESYTQQQQRIAAAYTNELNGLFDKIGLKDEADRKYIRAAINADVRANKQLATEISQGNMKNLVKVFKANANPYLEREAGLHKAKAEKIKTQEKHKQPVGGGGGAPTSDSMVDKDWKEVPKGKEDETLAAKLGSFFAGRGKKK